MSLRPSASILDHVGLRVSDYARSKAFYLSALEPLGIGLLLERGEYAGFGANGRPQFFIMLGSPVEAVHIAFHAPSRDHCKAFHKAALLAGGLNNGLPGLRPRYHQSYYGAFVLDPDGYNVEAVCHAPD